MFTLYVETDYDFSVIHNGKVYSDYSFTLVLESHKELSELKVGGPFGAPSDGKIFEFEDGVKQILKNNGRNHFSNLGGNRGIEWHKVEEVHYGLILEGKLYQVKRWSADTVRFTGKIKPEIHDFEAFTFTDKELKQVEIKPVKITW